MLYPQQNDVRDMFDLSGVWDFKLDPDEVGERERWFDGLESPRLIAVPASWNDQMQDTRDYMGMAWYFRSAYIPHGWRGQRIFMRVGSANYAARVWMNGTLIGEHHGGHLPFEFDITETINWGEPNAIAIQVENHLRPDRVPPGNLVGTGVGAFLRSYPATAFDFFPYAGLHRPVLLYSVPETHIQDVTVVTDVEGPKGAVTIRVAHGADANECRVALSGENLEEVVVVTSSSGVAETTIDIPNARFWSTSDPYLYKLSISLTAGGRVTDCYDLEVGVRTVEVRGNELLLNGEPVFLKGFGKHEDFPIHGRGLNIPLIVKDYSLLKWVGANSYRTSHYPYSEEAMMFADREGVLIVDEIPAVGLFFDDDEAGIQERLRLCKQQIRELVDRDKNHPSVIMWSLANEPFTIKGGFAALLGSEPPNPHPAAKPFFSELFDLTRELDPTRLVTLASMAGLADESLEYVDVILINRYAGWYQHSGQIELGIDALKEELDQIHQKFGKPMVISEFGADTIAGTHSDPPEMFSEEYQEELIESYLDLADRTDYLIGLHIWNFAEFKTSQSIMRPQGMNLKGVFTRDRRPKKAAHMLRERWGGK